MGDFGDYSTNGRIIIGNCIWNCSAENEKEKCLRLMRDNKGLKLLKVRLYLSYKAENGEYFAKEMMPSEINK